MSGSAGDEDFKQIQVEELNAVSDLLQNLNLTTQRTLEQEQQQHPPGMSPERFRFITLRLLQQQSGHLFASVNAAFAHQWSAFEVDDFVGLMRDPQPQNDDNDSDEDHHGFVQNNNNNNNNTVQDIYNQTRAAAKSTENFLSDSPTPMKAGGAVPARCCNQVELVAETVHLCPKTGVACKTDTWIYVAAAVLGLDADESPAVLMKALRGCWNSSQSTLHNTGLNRSPCNLLQMMEHQYLFDVSSCVILLPVMKVNEAKEWTGQPYRVIVLCDDDKHGRATHQQVAQRVGLCMTNAAAATQQDIADAIALLTLVLKFSAYALENKPPPPSIKGAILWEKYKDELEVARSLYASIVGVSRTELQHKVLIPVAKAMVGKIVATVDLGVLNHKVAKVIYPDPLLLTCKSSVNWTRKFGFQLMAEAETTDRFEHSSQLDPILGKNVEFGSQNDGSRSFGDFTG